MSVAGRGPGGGAQPRAPAALAPVPHGLQQQEDRDAEEGSCPDKVIPDPPRPPARGAGELGLAERGSRDLCSAQVWEVKESLRKKQRRERNNDHSLGPPGRSRAGSRRASLRSPGAGGGGANIAEVGLEILTHEYFRNKM